MSEKKMYVPFDNPRLKLDNDTIREYVERYFDGDPSIPAIGCNQCN
jgi:hypothetical protein